MIALRPRPPANALACPGRIEADVLGFCGQRFFELDRSIMNARPLVAHGDFPDTLVTASDRLTNAVLSFLGDGKVGAVLLAERGRQIRSGRVLIVAGNHILVRPER